MSEIKWVTTKANITCENCNHTFELHISNMDFFRTSPKCPLCLAQMEYQMVEKLFAVMGELDDLNRDFQKYKSERHENAFQVGLECPVVQASSDQEE